MTQAIEILERHRLFLIEVEREADVQDAIKAVAITVKQQAEEIQRLRDKTSALTQELDECGMLEKTLRELVKRHEAALEWLYNTTDYYGLYKNWKSGLYALCRTDNLECISPAMPTPLAAIEAAMKEGK